MCVICKNFSTAILFTAALAAEWQSRIAILAIHIATWQTQFVVGHRAGVDVADPS
jgi:hypothetical protein